MRTALIAFMLSAFCSFWSVSARSQSAEPKPRDQSSCEYACQLDYGPSRCQGERKEGCEEGYRRCLEQCRK